MKTSANGLSIEYEIFGAPNAPVMLLIMGLGSQLTRWPVPFCEKLAACGYRVIRFDNRDVGLSSWVDAPVPDFGMLMASMLMGQEPDVPYTLEDMMHDALGLLDALHIEQAHIVGASMGGMIAQLLAIQHPQRVLSLASVMSTTGNPMLPPASPAVTARIMTRPPADADAATIVAVSLDIIRALSSHTEPFDETWTRARVIEDTQRAYNPDGTSRQIAAIVANGDRRERLRGITAPTLVLHGEDDPLFSVAAAHDTAACIVGAQLRLIPGMGHELPARTHDVAIDAIVSNAQRARTTFTPRPDPQHAGVTI